MGAHHDLIPFRSLNPTRVCPAPASGLNGPQPWQFAPHPTGDPPSRELASVPLVRSSCSCAGVHRSWPCIPASPLPISVTVLVPAPGCGGSRPPSSAPVLSAVSRGPPSVWPSHSCGRWGLLLVPQPWAAGPPVPVRSGTQWSLLPVHPRSSLHLRGCCSVYLEGW